MCTNPVHFLCFLQQVHISKLVIKLHIPALQTSYISQDLLCVQTGLKPSMEPFYRLNDYDQVAELTWENGQVGFQGQVPATCTKFTWETANETLESIVQQGSTVFNKQAQNSNINLIQNSAANINSCSSFAASSSENSHPFTWLESGHCNNGINNSISACTKSLRECQTKMMAGTTEDDLVYNYGSDDKKDDQESKEVKGPSSSTRRSRTAAVHNQSERKRRDRINQKMKILQRLVPNASKTDKASMLDEVIKYLKNLQAHIQMMNYIRNMPQMMVPMGMQQQQMLHDQMSLLARAGINMNLGILGTGEAPKMMHTPQPAAQQSVPVPKQFLPSTSTSTNPTFQPFFMVPPMTTTPPLMSQLMNVDLYNKMVALCSQQANKTMDSQEKSNPTFQ